jgi:hypothetical protein
MNAARVEFDQQVSLKAPAAEDTRDEVIAIIALQHRPHKQRATFHRDIRRALEPEIIQRREVRGVSQLRL